MNESGCVTIKLYSQNRQWAGFGPRSIVYIPALEDSQLYAINHDKATFFIYIICNVYEYDMIRYII